MLPPCSCNNCPICAERAMRRAEELLAKHSPRGRDAPELRELVRLVVIAHLEQLEGWPGTAYPPGAFIRDLRMGEHFAEDHIDAIVARLPVRFAGGGSVEG